MTLLFEPAIHNRRAEVCLSPNDIQSAAPNQVALQERAPSLTQMYLSQQPQMYRYVRPLDISHMNDITHSSLINLKIFENGSCP